MNQSSVAEEGVAVPGHVDPDSRINRRLPRVALCSLPAAADSNQTNNRIGGRTRSIPAANVTRLTQLTRTREGLQERGGHTDLGLILRPVTSPPLPFNWTSPPRLCIT